ncbi:MAG: hypothetical protein JNM88_14085 [Chitinophagaceae bacterium]|nr:hypothetical protein [Chitinophagaceae bacterium]
MTITFRNQVLRVELSEVDNTIVYHVYWPDNSVRYLLLEPDTHGNPVWHYIDQDATTEAAEIGNLVEQLTS